MLLAITGPFASGKTELAHALRVDHGYEKPVTVTTRLPRENEVDGVDYHFKTQREFEKMIADGLFLEYALINGKYYGTLRSSVISSLEAGRSLALNVDIQGIISLSKSPDQIIRERLLSIYVEVSMRQAIRRAQSRPGGMPNDEIGTRFFTRVKEEELKHVCHHRVPNPDGSFSDALRQILALAQRRQMEWGCYR